MCSRNWSRRRHGGWLITYTGNCSGTWEDVITSQLHFDPGIRIAIRDLWLKNQAIARQHNETLTPMQFVEMFVEKNVTNT